MKFYKVSTLLLLFFISGCGGEPTTSEVAKAVEESFKNDSSFMTEQKLVGAMANAAGVQGLKFDSADKIGCEQDGKNAYICEVSVEYTINSTDGSLADLLGASGHKRSINKYRLVSTSKGWMVAQSIN